MKDYYLILGIPQNASSLEIRSAFKEKALLYHPDRNPGDPNAEEIFKSINEAYQILGKPIARQQYDYRVAQAQTRPQYKARPRPPYPPRPVYNYHTFEWEYKRGYPHTKTYVFDKKYFHHQILAFVIFGLIAAAILTGSRVSGYFKNLEHSKILAQQEQMHHQAQAYFTEGKPQQALEIMKSLIKANPFETEYKDGGEQMVIQLRDEGQQMLAEKHFMKALLNFNLVKKYQRYQSLDIWLQIAECYLGMGESLKAFKTMEYVHIREPHDMQLVLQMGIILMDSLNQPREAMQYFEKGKERFKSIQQSKYGKAYPIIMKADEVPKVYSDLFLQCARANIYENDFNKALGDSKWAVFLKNDNPEAFYYRGLCYLQLGDSKKACGDFKEAIKKNLPDRLSAKISKC